MTTYTWDAGGSDDLWTNSDNWDANGVPGDDAVVKADTINIPKASTVDLRGVDHSAFSNGVGDIRITGSTAGNTTFIHDPAPTDAVALRSMNFKLHEAATISENAAGGDRVIWQFGDRTTRQLRVSPSEGSWVFEQVDQTGASVREIFEQNAFPDGAAGAIELYAYDNQGWIRRWDQVSSLNGTTGVTLSTDLAGLAVGQDVVLVGPEACFYTTIAAKTGTSVTLTDNYSAVHGSTYSLSQWVAWGAVFLVRVDSNGKFIGMGRSGSYLSASGLVKADLNCGLRKFAVVMHSNQSGGGMHAHNCQIGGVVDSCSQIFSLGTSRHFYGTAVGGSIDRVSGFSTSQRGDAVTNSYKSHSIGGDKLKTAIINFDRIAPHQDNQASNAGMVSLSDFTWASFAHFIEGSSTGGAGDNTDYINGWKNINFINQIDRSDYGNKVTESNSTGDANWRRYRLFRPPYPDKVVEGCDFYGTMPLVNLDDAEQNTAFRTKNCTFAQPAAGFIGAPDSDLFDDIKDYWRTDFATMYSSTKLSRAVQHKNLTITFPTTTPTGVNAFYAYYLDVGDAGNVQKGNDANPIGTPPAGMNANSYRFQFLADTCPLVITETVQVTGGSASLSAGIHLVDAMAIMQVEIRKEANNIFKREPFRVGTNPDWEADPVSVGNPATTGSRQAINASFSGLADGEYEITLVIWGVDNGIYTYSSTQTAWVDELVASGSGSGGTKKIISHDVITR